jgi:hypothetical protein
MCPPIVSCLRIVISFAVLIGVLSTSYVANAQCPGTILTDGLYRPNKLIQTTSGNLIVAEGGLAAPNSGRISIVGLDGTRRTLLDGLPSGLNAKGDYVGTQGIFLSGSSLYVLNGEGDSTVAGPVQGSELPNPAPSSPLNSSVLVVHFTGAVEKVASGVQLTYADQQALKNGQTVSNADYSLSVDLIADLPDFVPDALPSLAQNVRASEPSGIVGIRSELFISDAGLNAILRVDTSTGAVSVLTTFAAIANPTTLGPSTIDASPSSIHDLDGDLLVTLFRGYPYVPGNSSVARVNRRTGAITTYMSGLTSLADVFTVKFKGWTAVFTLESSLDLLSDQPGRLQRFTTAATAGVPISTCLIRPGGIIRDDGTGTLYITETTTGRIIQIQGVELIPVQKL